MGIFDQFFGKKKIEKKGKDSQYLPKEDGPTHIEFVHNYIGRGGNLSTVKMQDLPAITLNLFFKRTIGHTKIYLHKMIFYLLFLA